MNDSTQQKFEDTIFLIPARSGSKGIPKKNLQKINELTLIEITIRQALKVCHAEQIYLSSDSTEILKYAEILKVKSIVRTHKESSDDSDANTVIKHFIEIAALGSCLNTSIVYLQPTSPFRFSSLITNCILLHKEFNKPVVTVRKVFDHPQKMVSVKNQKIKNYSNDFRPSGNRQTLPELFIPSGSVYVFSIENFLENGCKIPIIDAVPVEVYGENMIDIDSEIDLILAQKIGENYDF